MREQAGQIVHPVAGSGAVDVEQAGDLSTPCEQLGFVEVTVDRFRTGAVSRPDVTAAATAAARSPSSGTIDAITQA